MESNKSWLSPTFQHNIRPKTARSTCKTVIVLTVPDANSSTKEKSVSSIILLQKKLISCKLQWSISHQMNKVKQASTNLTKRISASSKITSKTFTTTNWSNQLKSSTALNQKKTQPRFCHTQKFWCIASTLASKSIRRNLSCYRRRFIRRVSQRTHSLRSLMKPRSFLQSSNTWTSTKVRSREWIAFKISPPDKISRSAKMS